MDGITTAVHRTTVAADATIEGRRGGPRGGRRFGVAVITATVSLTGCSVLPGGQDDESTATTIAVELIDPATFQAQGTRDTWCAAVPDGVARPLGDKSIFLGDEASMRAAFEQEYAILANLEPAVPPELAADYVSAVNGTKQLEAAVVAANFKLDDTGREFSDADNQLSLAWNALNGYSRSQCA